MLVWRGKPTTNRSGKKWFQPERFPSFFVETKEISLALSQFQTRTAASFDLAARQELSGFDGWRGAETGAEAFEIGLAFVKGDFDRHALHDFGEVAARVIGRK
ncbi:hypothetical protein B1R32_10815 [Abditibacterium utsteinense]|uniref:Uncharacterized protein n=1 Tax=Abditibacterium utsteinense TaxID=1960156 RepID=A0A2S8SSN5_9BACT|nr:hypothetical protein B1R32_10815 [Abditibacterium utsteinense]